MVIDIPNMPESMVLISVFKRLYIYIKDGKFYLCLSKPRIYIVYILQTDLDE